MLALPTTRRIAALVLVCGLSASCVAQEAADLAVDQTALASKFERLEALALRIAELVEAEDAERAEQLRGAVRKSRELAVADRFAAIAALLESERLAAAGRDQQLLADQLGQLMRLLLADPSQARAEAERKKLEKLLKDLRKFIKTQQSLRNDLFDGQELKRVTDEQQQLADDLKQSRGTLEDGKQPADPSKPSEGKPSDNQPSGGQPEDGQPNEGQLNNGQSQPGDPNGESQKPIDRAQRRLAEAQRAMQQAIEALEAEKTDQAKSDQSDAQQRLEDARREIEEALKQLREEEQIRMLTRLATRFRRMLAEQTAIYELTQSTAEKAPATVDRATRLAAAGLAEREQALVVLADGALRLLEADGKSIAFPETIEQVRGDMRQAAAWLADVRIGRATQQLEQDIIEQLQQAIAAFEQAAAEKQQQRQQAQSGQPQAGPQDGPSLVDLLAELRMIRSLQTRLLRRTEMWDTLLAEGEVTPGAAHEALDRLAKNQERLSAAAQSLGKAMENR